MKARYGKLTTDCARENSKGTDFKMLQLLFRFVVGGFVVSLFAALGTILKPKSFAGLFGAALVTLQQRPVLSGVLFGLLAYKPQFGLLIPVALLAASADFLLPNA